MPAPDGAPSTEGGTPPPAPSAPRSYSNVVSTPTLRLGPPLKPVPLAARSLSYVDATPLVVFSPVEVEQLNKQKGKHFDHEVLGR